MTDAVAGITLLWVIMFIYAIAGSVDFGAGFWALWYARHKQTTAATIANRYLSPLWEVTNVFLVLFSVALVGLFPGAAYTLGELLLVPGCLILILLTIRTVFMTYAHSVERYQYSMRVISGITGLLIPALLLTVFPIAQGGFVSSVQGHATLALGTLLTSPVTYAYIALGLTSELLLSALILADFSRVGQDASAFAIYRRNAFRLSPVNIAFAATCLWVITRHTIWLQSRLWHEQGWFIGSALCFVASMALLWSARQVTQSRFRLAVIMSIGQYFLAIMGYGIAHLPYLVYPFLTIQNSFTNSEMFRASVIVLIVGLAVLFPGFVWLWRLFLENRSYAGKS